MYKLFFQFMNFFMQQWIFYLSVNIFPRPPWSPPFLFSAWNRSRGRDISQAYFRFRVSSVIKIDYSWDGERSFQVIWGWLIFQAAGSIFWPVTSRFAVRSLTQLYRCGSIKNADAVNCCRLHLGEEYCSCSIIYAYLGTKV